MGSNLTDSEAVVRANMRALMATRRVQVNQVAQVLGVDRQTMSKRLNGKAHISINDIGRLAAFFQVSVAFFFRDPDWMPSDLKGAYVRSAA